MLIDMWTAVVLASALATATAEIISNDVETCGRDGVFADYETDCQEFFRCLGGAVKARYVCGPGRMFSEAAGGCVPRGRARACVRRLCAPGERGAYVTPGTACRNYYRCENGSVAAEHACPPGAWFDLPLQACTHGAGTCFEPVCAGLVDGEYPDASQDCRRTLSCRGAALVGVASCGGSRCGAACPPPRSVAVPVPAGDADFCSDATCSSLCSGAPDGAHADRSSGCREFFLCEAGRVTRRGACEPGRLFAQGGCKDARDVRCAAPARGPCANKPDGPHRDWRDCASWFECRRERVVSRGSCAAGDVFDGERCVAPSQFYCKGPRAAAECERRPSGYYQDLESNCTRYYRCEGGRQTLLACGAGRVFDGEVCVAVSGYECPSLAAESCYRRADGRHKSAETGCRGYYACAAGQKALYACSPGQAFVGDACAPAPPGVCAAGGACAALADGYHPEPQSNCHRYFYCEGGERLAMFSCHGGKVFDGRACGDPARHRCGAPRGSAGCARDGFHTQPATNCTTYFFCLTGKKTQLQCPKDQLFNGQVCVPKELFTCPG